MNIQIRPDPRSGIISVYVEDGGKRALIGRGPVAHPFDILSANLKRPLIEDAGEPAPPAEDDLTTDLDDDFGTVRPR